MQLISNFHQRKEIHNIFLPYLFIFFQSEKISIKHSMQLTITFIKEMKSKIWFLTDLSLFCFTLKRLALSILCNWQWLSSKKEIQNIFLPYLFIFFQSEKIRIKHSMQLIITSIKERNPWYILTLSLLLNNIFLLYLFILFQSEKISK